MNSQKTRKNTEKRLLAMIASAKTQLETWNLANGVELARCDAAHTVAQVKVDRAKETLQNAIAAMMLKLGYTDKRGNASPAVYDAVAAHIGMSVADMKNVLDKKYSWSNPLEVAVDAFIELKTEEVSALPEIILLHEAVQTAQAAANLAFKNYIALSRPQGELQSTLQGHEQANSKRRNRTEMAKELLAIKAATPKKNGAAIDVQALAHSLWELRNKMAEGKINLTIPYIPKSA